MRENHALKLVQGIKQDDSSYPMLVEYGLFPLLYAILVRVSMIVGNAIMPES